VLPLVDASTVKDVRSELTLIRDKINGLLEALDITNKVPPTWGSAEQPQPSSTGMFICVSHQPFVDPYKLTS